MSVVAQLARNSLFVEIILAFPFVAPLAFFRRPVHQTLCVRVDAQLHRGTGQTFHPGHFVQSVTGPARNTLLPFGVLDGFPFRIDKKYPFTHVCFVFLCGKKKRTKVNEFFT